MTIEIIFIILLLDVQLILKDLIGMVNTPNMLEQRLYGNMMQKTSFVIFLFCPPSLVFDLYEGFSFFFPQLPNKRIFSKSIIFIQVKEVNCDYQYKNLMITIHYFRVFIYVYMDGCMHIIYIYIYIGFRIQASEKSRWMHA